MCISSTTQAGHIGGNATADATANPDLKYRTPLAPALDGNTVDAQLEQAAFAENAVRYQATLTFLNSKFRGLHDRHHGWLAMSSFKAFDIAGSGMSAQSVRLNTTASNLANAESVSGDPNRVYKARHPIFEAVRAQLAASAHHGRRQCRRAGARHL